MSALLKPAVAAVVTSILLMQPAFAAGGGGEGGPMPTVEKCKKGEVWDKNKKKCVKKSSAVDDDSLFEAGRDLAKSGRYEEAIDILRLVSDQNAPRVLNYLGYANRKAGRLETGLAYYRKAIALDPDYVLARSYMGEALANSGDRQGALIQLAEIRKRTGPQGEAYTLLAAAIREGAVY